MSEIHRIDGSSSRRLPFVKIESAAPHFSQRPVISEWVDMPSGARSPRVSLANVIEPSIDLDRLSIYD